MLHTVLCDVLDIELPVLNAPMGGGVAGGRLAAAVSAAGGLGLIGGQTAGGVPWLREQLAVARAHGDRPVGVGFISHLPPTAALVDAALEEGVRVLCHSFVDPAPWVEPARRSGAVVLAQVQSVALARRAVEAGVDVIIAQGTEAGGHTGPVGLLALLPRVVDVAGGPDGIPVVAAGAIADGRTMAAALLLGAAGVLVGTRFVATEECDGRPSVRRHLVAADADATVLTEVFDLAAGLRWPEGVRGRSLRSPFTDRWHGHEAELRAWGRDDRARYRTAAQTDDDLADRYAGQGVGLIDAVEPAGVVLRQLAAEAEAVLRHRPAAVLVDGSG